jgi:hypothetical protein
MSFPRSTWHTAKVTHTCETCLRKIRPRERYRRDVGTWEGEFYNQALCLFCMGAWGFLRWLEGDHDEICDPAQCLSESRMLQGYVYAFGIETGWEYCRPAPALTMVPA